MIDDRAIINKIIPHENVNVKILISVEEIEAGVAQLGRDISDYYEGKSLTIIGVLTGSVILLADLIRQLELPLRVGVIQARSYRGAATSPGKLAIEAEFLPEITGHHVLLIDDIFDTGQTLSSLLEQLSQMNPASLRSAVLLQKSERKEVAMQPDHIVFQIPNEFVVGYGLDYQDAYRNLPYIAVLDEGEL